MKEELKNFFKNSLESLSLTDSEASNKKIAGYTCSYIPEELITAAGFVPYRISGNKESNLADKYFPINFCPYIKAVWEEIHHNNKLKTLILATSCDGMRRLNDFVYYYEKTLPTFILDIPRKSDESSIDFFAKNLEKLWIFLCKINETDPNKTDKIIDSVNTISKKRRLLRELTKLFEKSGNPVIKNTQYFDIINISLSSKPAVFNIELENYIKQITNKYSKKEEKNKNLNSLNILLIGNYINDANFWSVFEDLDVKLLASDLCITGRYFNIVVEDNLSNFSNNSDIFHKIANAYIAKPACFRMASLGINLEQLHKKIINNNIKGVIFTSLKFCDNTLYSFPAIKNELSKMKIPSIFLDIEYGKSSYGQLKTRIEAFSEMLSL